MTDLEIASQAKMKPIGEIAAMLGLLPEEVEPYGHYKGKISLDVLKRVADRPDGKLILVTSINPTTAGEGKTTTTVGLAQALWQIGKKAVSATREPSLGPVMGMKGGAAGGGYAQVVPMEDINLHFTGDFHAITSAHNLLAAMVDNHLQQGNALDIDPRQITWPRCLDMNDRALRHIVLGLGGRGNGVPREGGFVITVASEVMAILCLAHDVADLKARLGRMVVAYTRSGKPVTAKDLKAVGAMVMLLKDAIKPNLVQTLEGTPALIHGGPFANIAHGNSSILATQLGLKLADYVVTEGGFGADLGGEKFFDIVMREAGFRPNAVVVVATVRALKLHGGVKAADLGREDVGAVERGLENLRQAVSIVRGFGIDPVVALNRFDSDTPAEVEACLAMGRELGVPVVLSEVWAKGGKGGVALAEAVVAAAERSVSPKPIYDLDQPIKEKIETIAKKVYGADGVEFSSTAERAIKRYEDMGYGNLAVCMAKTQYSLSDDPTLVGRPTGFKVHVRDVELSAGAGFVVPILGEMLRMPGLPKVPAAERMDLDDEGHVQGLF
jgi:formate--tetrahydrofolate ligase